jgi:hypothetical protein
MREPEAWMIPERLKKKICGLLGEDRVVRLWRAGCRHKSSSLRFSRTV